MSKSALRRAIHASTAALVWVGGTVGWADFKIWIAGAAVAGVLAEIIRIRRPPFAAFLAKTVPVFRPEESRRPSGALWLLVGYAAAAWLPVPGPAAGMLVGAVADPAAAAVGERWGGGAAKSWVGTAAAWVSAAVLLALLGLAPRAVVVGSLAAAALERWSRPLDDNLVIAPGVAALVWIAG